MPVPQQEAVIVASLTLLRDHSDLLRDPGARQAQLRQIENAYGLIQECTDAAGHLHLDGASAATVFSLHVSLAAGDGGQADVGAGAGATHRLDGYARAAPRPRDHPGDLSGTI
jgi:hypothetical protein